MPEAISARYRFAGLRLHGVSFGFLDRAFVVLAQLGNVNVQMLRHCDPAAYLRAERAAEIDRIVVWGMPGGITRPWVFRRQRRR